MKIELGDTVINDSFKHERKGCVIFVILAGENNIVYFKGINSDDLYVSDNKLLKIKKILLTEKYLIADMGYDKVLYSRA